MTKFFEVDPETKRVYHKEHMREIHKMRVNNLILQKQVEINKIL